MQKVDLDHKEKKMTDKNKVNEVDLKAKVEPVTTTEEVDMERFLNRGTDVKFSFGTYKFREPVFDVLLDLVESCFAAVMILADDPEEIQNKTEAQIMSELFLSKQMRTQMKRFVALHCGIEDEKELDKMKLSDFNEFIRVAKSHENYIQEIKELFTLTGLQNLLPQMPSMAEAISNKRKP